MESWLKMVTEKRHVRWFIIITDLKINCKIGIYPMELDTPQTIKISLKCGVNNLYSINTENNPKVCYDKLAKGIRKLLQTQHIYLLEQAAVMIANFCFNYNEDIFNVWLKIEKITAIADAAGAGVEFFSQRSDKAIEYNNF